MSHCYKKSNPPTCSELTSEIIIIIKICRTFVIALNHVCICVYIYIYIYIYFTAIV